MIHNLNITKLNKDYKKNGFVKIEKFLSSKEINFINSDIKFVTKILKKRKKKYAHLHFTRDGKVNTLHNINKLKVKSYLKKLAKSKKIQDLIKFILVSRSIKVRNIEFFLKPKKTGLASPIHQDNFYWNIVDPYKAINMWIACDKSNKSNGGVFYYPASHTKGLLPHIISNQKGSSQMISKKKLDQIKIKRKYISLKKGDCVIHHPEVIHGSNANLSSRNRSGVVISFKSRNALINKLNIKRYKSRVKKNLQSLYKKEFN